MSCVTPGIDFRKSPPHFAATYPPRLSTMRTPAGIFMSDFSQDVFFATNELSSLSWM